MTACRNGKFSTSRKRASRARHTHHRPAGEIVHEPPQNPRPADGRGQSRLQHQHRSPARCGSPGCPRRHSRRAVVAGPTRWRRSGRARSCQCYGPYRGCGRITVLREMQRRHAGFSDDLQPHLGAPRPAMAGGTTWSGEGRHLPAGTPAQSAAVCRTSSTLLAELGVSIADVRLGHRL